MASSSQSSLFDSAIADDANNGNDMISYDNSPVIPMSRSNSSNSVSYLDLSKLLLANDFDFGLGLESVGDSTKRRFNDMKTKTKQSVKRRLSRSDPNSDLNKLQDKLLNRLTKLDQTIHENLQSSATEKAFYAFAVGIIALAGFLIGKYPEWFHIFYTILFALLMPIRFYTYFKQQFQYYLADLCYYVNLLLILFIWAFPDSKSLFVSVFSLTMGTLSFAVITWRNSLVLHLIEKTTSSFIHVMPPVVMFVIVHELPQDFIAERFPAVSKVESWHFINGILWTSLYYTIWQVSYHYFITIRRKKEIENGKVTSFTYLKKKNSKAPIGKFVNSLPYNWLQIVAFTLIQFGYQIGTMLLCPIWFKYKHACGAFMSLIFLWASYNGATYYIDVFGNRLEKEVAKLRKEVIELRDREKERGENLDTSASAEGEASDGKVKTS